MREFLQSAIQYPRERPELFELAGIRPPRGILFAGPSGTGKSLVARALAGEAGLSLITADERRWLLSRTEPYDVIVVDVMRPTSAYSG